MFAGLFPCMKKTPDDEIKYIKDVLIRLEHCHSRMRSYSVPGY